MPLDELPLQYLVMQLRAWENESCRALQDFSRDVLARTDVHCFSWDDFNGDPQTIRNALASLPKCFDNVQHARAIQLAMEAAENDDICQAYGVEDHEKTAFASWLMHAIPLNKGMPPLSAWAELRV